MKHLIRDNQIVLSVQAIPGTFTRENGQTFWGGYQNMTTLHYEDGWRDDQVPVVDWQTQQLGEKYFDSNLDKVTWTVVPKILPQLQELKDNLHSELSEVIKEVSGIVSVLKNIYDPLRTNPENIPTDLVILINQILPLRDRAKLEIESLATSEEAINYIIKGPEVLGYIEQLKSFL